MKLTDGSPFALARRLGLLGAAAFLVAGCVGAAAGPTGPDESASPGPASPDASASPATSSGSGFYLRAWQTQALAPQYTFGSLPAATVADGRYIDGMVAIPMIYPGPVYVGLSARSINAAGIDAIVAEARADGLLGSKSDFSESIAPGAALAHVELIVDGTTYELTGSPLPAQSLATVGPGTASAFATFWASISTIDTWLAADLSASAPYSPTRVAVMLTPPVEVQQGLVASKEVPWPLSGTLDKFGTAMSVSPYRCGTVSGADLATLLPVIQNANQLTRFVDSDGNQVSLQARVLVPGEPGPCA